MNTEDVTTEALLAEYKATATAWDLAQGDARQANPLFDRVYELARELRQTDAGRVGITALMGDANVGVRLMAAAHSLRWAPTEVTEVLEQVASGNGLHAVTAKYVLKEFRAGKLRTDW